MTLPEPADSAVHEPEKPDRRGGWLVALVALPVLCCAAPALLAAVGVGSLGALLAATGGRVTLALVLMGLAGGLLALVVLRRRSGRSGQPSQRAAPPAAADQ